MLISEPFTASRENVRKAGDTARLKRQDKPTPSGAASEQDLHIRGVDGLIFAIKRAGKR